MKDIDANATILRKVKDTIRGSVYDQIVWAIYKLGVQDKWKIPEEKLTITYKPTGQQIRFRGADKPQKVKSAAFARGYSKYIWYEELDEFNGPDEIRMINQSLMRGGEDFVVFYSYNPPKSSVSWVNVEAKRTHPARYVHHSSYLGVPEQWLGPIFIMEAEVLRESNQAAYDHEYMGVETGTGGEVFLNVKIRPISDEEISGFESVHRGLDYGFAADPLAYVVCAYDRKHRRLYIYHELYQQQVSNTCATDRIKTENKHNDTVLADSAEPKSISQMQQLGLKIQGVKKGPDSIDFGIKFLQDLDQIIIDDKRCPNTAREFTTYELERDSHGNFKAGYPDRNNHTIDAVRYAMSFESRKWWEKKTKESKQDHNWDFEKPKPDPFKGGKAHKSYIDYGI